MRILLIEDDRLIGDGLKTGLEKLGFAVDWFTDGLEGEEALMQAPYEAVVLDLGLPGQDGLTVLKNWRNRGRNEPVLVLTAQGDVDQRMVVRMSGGRRRPLSAIAPGNKRPFCAFFPFGLVECVPVRGNG